MLPSACHFYLCPVSLITDILKIRLKNIERRHFYIQFSVQIEPENGWSRDQKWAICSKFFLYFCSIIFIFQWIAMQFSGLLYSVVLLDIKIKPFNWIHIWIYCGQKLANFLAKIDPRTTNLAISWSFYV